jgi:hypothetical protein
MSDELKILKIKNTMTKKIDGNDVTHKCVLSLRHTELKCDKDLM